MGKAGCWEKPTWVTGLDARWLLATPEVLESVDTRSGFKQERRSAKIGHWTSKPCSVRASMGAP